MPRHKQSAVMTFKKHSVVISDFSPIGTLMCLGSGWPNHFQYLLVQPSRSQKKNKDQIFDNKDNKRKVGNLK